MSNAKHTSGPWRFEESTKTIRAVPNNYWLATMDSFDGAVNHDANARLIAAAPELYQALHDLFEQCAMTHKYWGENCNREQADDAIRRGQELLDQIEGRKVQS